MPKQPLVKCRNCQNLVTFHDPEGMLCRCSKGFFDKPYGAMYKHPVYLSILSLKAGNVIIWKATEKCGKKFKLAIDESAKE